MYRSQRSGGSMMWMSLSRTRNPLCAMIRLSSRCRGRLTPRAPHDTPPGTIGHLLEAALLVLRGDPDGLSLHAYGKDLGGQRSRSQPPRLRYRGSVVSGHRAPSQHVSAARSVAAAGHTCWSHQVTIIAVTTT